MVLCNLGDVYLMISLCRNAHKIKVSVSCLDYMLFEPSILPLVCDGLANVASFEQHIGISCTHYDSQQVFQALY